MSPSFSSTLDPAALTSYVTHLLDNHLPDGTPVPDDLRAAVDDALKRTERCFAGISRKYYTVDGHATFDHLNGDHMATFLYFVSNSAWTLSADTVLATKLFYLNRILHGLDLYFSVRMPEVFLLVHPVGSVIGAAEYGEDLVVYQNCTIGSDSGVYPRFGRGTILFSRSSVLGACVVGDDVVFAANSFLIDTDVPSDTIVAGQYPQHRLLPNSRPVRERMFDQPRPVGS